jgi:hypothetical protein
MKPVGNPWVPANPMGGFGQNFKPIMGTGFSIGIDTFHGYGFGMEKNQQVCTHCHL